MESKELAELVKQMVDELKQVNVHLNYICTEGIFVKVDEGISEN